MRSKLINSCIYISRWCYKSWKEKKKTQADDSGHQILKDPAGKMRESTGNRWNMKVVFRTENFRLFSGGFLPTSCTFLQELVGKHWKKSEKFPARILLPQNHRNYPEPAVSGPDSSTWGLIKRKFNQLPCKFASRSVKPIEKSCSNWVAYCCSGAEMSIAAEHLPLPRRDDK